MVCNWKPQSAIKYCHTQRLHKHILFHAGTICILFLHQVWNTPDWSMILLCNDCTLSLDKERASLSDYDLWSGNIATTNLRTQNRLEENVWRFPFYNQPLLFLDYRHACSVYFLGRKGQSEQGKHTNFACLDCLRHRHDSEPFIIVEQSFKVKSGIW